MNTHILKIDPEFFEGVKSGEKTFEVRINDRNYQKGDLVRLLPYCRKINGYVEPYGGIGKRISYILSGHGIKEGYVVFSIENREGAEYDVTG
jgi:hypothetical protein